MSHTEIAASLNITPQSVSNIITSPEAQALIARVGRKSVADVGQRIADAAGEAFDEVLDQMRDDTLAARERRACAFGILDRAGFSKIEKKMVVRARIPESLADTMLEAAREARSIGRDLTYSLPALPALPPLAAPNGGTNAQRRTEEEAREGIEVEVEEVEGAEDEAGEEEVLE